MKLDKKLSLYKIEAEQKYWLEVNSRFEKIKDDFSDRLNRVRNKRQTEQAEIKKWEALLFTPLPPPTNYMFPLGYYHEFKYMSGNVLWDIRQSFDTIIIRGHRKYHDYEEADLFAEALSKFLYWLKLSKERREREKEKESWVGKKTLAKVQERKKEIQRLEAEIRLILYHPYH